MVKIILLPPVNPEGDKYIALSYILQALQLVLTGVVSVLTEAGIRPIMRHGQGNPVNTG